MASRQFSINQAQGQFFQVKVDGYDGRWTDLRLGATRQLNRGQAIHGGAEFRWHQP